MSDVSVQLGHVFAVPDKWWGFQAEGREDHPGACVLEIRDRREWILLKGTGAGNYEKLYETEVLIYPTEENGLLKDTIFSLKPRPKRDHQVRNLIPERVMGNLSGQDLKVLQSRMLEQFGSGAS